MAKIIGNELYLIKGEPIVDVLEDKSIITSDECEYFLVNPVFCDDHFADGLYMGGKTVVEFVEAISKTEICKASGNKIFDIEDGWVRERGSVLWTVRLDHTADKLIKKEAIDKYFNQSFAAVKERVAEIRRKAAEIEPYDDFAKAFRR